jgi:hypothetical protein
MKSKVEKKFISNKESPKNAITILQNSKILGNETDVHVLLLTI